MRRSIQSASRRIFSSGGKPEVPPTKTSPPATAQPPPAKEGGIKYAKTSAGTGAPDGAAGGSTAFSTRGPVTWPALGLVAIVAGSAVAYYRIERERRLENAMGKIVRALLSNLFVSR